MSKNVNASMKINNRVAGVVVGDTVYVMRMQGDEVQRLKVEVIDHITPDFIEVSSGSRFSPQSGIYLGTRSVSCINECIFIDKDTTFWDLSIQIRTFINKEKLFSNLSKAAKCSDWEQVKYYYNQLSQLLETH